MKRQLLIYGNNHCHRFNNILQLVKIYINEFIIRNTEVRVIKSSQYKIILLGYDKTIKYKTNKSNEKELEFIIDLIDSMEMARLGI